jgi:hypothetical protein
MQKTLILWEDALNRDTALIPVLRTNFWAYIFVERVFYVHDVIGMVRTNFCLGRIDLKCTISADICTIPAISLDVLMSKDKKLLVDC